jgi:Putative inner membrane protein (DUF1819)
MLRMDQGTLSIDRTPLGYALGAISAAAEDEMPNQKTGPRYRADITAGSLKVTESRRIADLLLHEVDADGWTDAIVKRNILQARTPATARRLARLIRSRLESMGPDLWKLVRDGKGSVATHAVFAAAVKQSPLLGDFLGMVVADQYRRFGKTISNKMFADYLDGCRERDPLMPAWTEETQGGFAVLYADIKRAVVAGNTDVILFNIDAKAAHGNETGRDLILRVFLKVLNELQGYSGDHPHIAHMERYLDGKGKFETFQDAYKKLTGNAKTASQKEVGILVPLYDFYPSIESFLDTVVKKTIDQAGSNPSLQPADIKLLQVLFLIRYVEEMKGNVDNLVTLCLDQMDGDRLALRRHIEESLGRLEKETLISRNGAI